MTTVPTITRKVAQYARVFQDERDSQATPHTSPRTADNETCIPYPDMTSLAELSTTMSAMNRLLGKSKGRLGVLEPGEWRDESPMFKEIIAPWRQDWIERFATELAAWLEADTPAFVRAAAASCTGLKL